MDENDYRNIPEDQRADLGVCAQIDPNQPAARIRAMLADDVPLPPAASEGIPFLRGNGQKSPTREKTWAECTPEERQERLRGELQRQAAELRHVRERVGLLLQHQHGEAGALLVPVYGVGMEGCSAGLDGWKPFDPLA